MDKVTLYKQKVREIMENYVQTRMKTYLPGEEIYVVTDEEHGHYLLFRSVWQGNSRNYGYFVHARVKNEKVYVEYDGTDYEKGFTGFFEEGGVPKEDIVLAFLPPSVRKHTEYAIS